MEPGEYLTNVLSCNNFATICYEYFEAQTLSPATARKHLQRLEAGWRQEGKLVHCDPFRDGIWIFSNPSTPSSSSASEAESSRIIETHGVRLLAREKGTYEPASLARSRQIGANTLGTPSNSSSPSSSLDSTIRNSQTLNARSIHQSSSQGSVFEPPTPSPGVRSGNGTTDPSPSQKDVHEYLISAVLGSIVYRLCRDSGFIPLNLRTLILTPPKVTNSSILRGEGFQRSNEITLATLDIGITSLGTLVIKAHSDAAPGLQSLVTSSRQSGTVDKLSPGTALWLAPGGTAAKYYGISDDMTLPGNQSVSQVQTNLVDNRSTSLNAVTIHSWQSKCLEWLSAKGLDTTILESGGWVFVQVLGGHPPYSSTEYQGIPILDDLTVVPWPALLCFQTSSSSSRELHGNYSNIRGTRDPLSFAEHWFTGKDERASTLLQRQKERQIAEALSREQADGEARALQSNSYSPMALRRSSNAGAMYPTPPDALHHPIGATPSFDGTVSTPGNPNLFPSNDLGGNISSNPPVPDIDTEMWGSSEKKDRNNSSINFNDNDNDNDNLFGDISGGDIFAADVTDADFNFFDTPDDDLLHDTPSSPIPVAISGVQEEVNLEGELALGGSDPNLPEVPDIEMQDQSGTVLDGGEVVAASTAANDTESKTEIPGSGSGNSLMDKPPQPSISPPFDKEAVFNRLFRSLQDDKPQGQSGRAISFNKIDFEKSLVSVNQKYGAHGQFSFLARRKSFPRLGISELPKTEYLNSRRRIQDSKLQANFARILMEEVASPIKPSDPMDYLMDSDGGSQVSEQDDTSNTTDDQSFPSDLVTKKKWQWEADDGNGISTPFDALAMEFEHIASTPKSINGSQIPLLDADPADWSLTTYFTSPEPEIQSNALSDFERIATAQILADQAVSGTLRLPGSSGNDTPTHSTKSSSMRELMHSLVKAARVCLNDLTTCTMRTFLDIQGIPVLNQTLRLPPRPIPPPRGLSMSDASKANNPFSIPPPQLELRRSDAKLSVLPSAVNFWENLGLSPSKGAKDISAVCVYPNIEGVPLFADAFLDQMRSIYESSRLGTHDRVMSKDLANGLLPFTIDPNQQSKIHHLAALKETAGRLSRVLSSHPVEEKNFVVYFVYPVDDAALLVHICSAFQHLFNLYRKALLERKMNTANELVLQLIPMDFIASSMSIVVQSPTEYGRLAMEVYDRCIDFSSSSSSPAIMLEQPLPKSIDFKLSVNPSASLLQENTCLHIAYAQSIDDRWITAAWTDNRGTQQMTASYCLGRKNEPMSMPFSDIANEIWETTLDYIASKKIHWRIMIARVGVMDPSEMDFWMGLVATESDAQVSLTLVTVQTDPSLRLLPNSVTLPPNGIATQSVITPVSTPQASQTSIISPENASTPAKDTQNAPTPGEPPAEPDNDARLIDYTDQSWGAVLSHRLNNSNSLLELNPALISGYLIKRGGTSIDDPPIVIEVNIVHSEVVGNPRTFHESLLKEILGYYRGLGTLARVRGVVDPVRDGRPWHIAAAEKAVKALYMLM